MLLNLESQELSSVKYKINRFPDGEVQLEVFDMDRIDKINIKGPIRNAEELFIFVQALDLFKNYSRRKVIIPYLMSARNDRKMVDGRPVNLEIVLHMIRSYMNKGDELTIFTPHNGEAIKSFFLDSGINLVFIYPILDEISGNPFIVYPDEGAFKRFSNNNLGYSSTMAIKSRDMETGWINSYKVCMPTDLSKFTSIIVFDDLVDGGATFKILFESIKDIKLEKILFVTHFIQADKLIELSNMFDKVYVSSTYQKLPVKENIIEIDMYQSYNVN